MIKQTNSVQAKHAPLLGLFLNGYENGCPLSPPPA